MREPQSKHKIAMLVSLLIPALLYLGWQYYLPKLTHLRPS
jgi:hypothetical protein